MKGYASIPEGQISYRMEGSGKPVLLLHQTPWSLQEYSLMIPILAKSFRVIAMDTMGYGNSDNPPSEFELEDFARSVVSFLDALKLKKVSLVGHHTGAKIAVEVAAAYPERVEKMVLSGLSYKEPKDEKVMVAELESKVRAPAEDGAFLLDIWKMIVNCTVNKKMEIFLKGFVYNVDAITRTYDAHQAMARYNVRPRLPLIKCPVLALSGDKDMFINDLPVLKKVIPNCQTKVIKDGAVPLCLERPEEFAAAVIEFLGGR